MLAQLVAGSLKSIGLRRAYKNPLLRAIDMQKTRLLSRRAFLTILVTFSLVIILVIGLQSRALGFWYQKVRTRLSRYTKPRLVPSELGMLSENELQVIKALFEVIAPTPAPSTEDLVRFVNRRTSTRRGYYHEYKDGIALLESKAHGRFATSFAALEQQLRENILREVMTGPVSFTRMIFFKPETHFQEFLFMDLLRFYWSSSAGWAAVGYRSYPGVPDHPRAYTMPPVLTTEAAVVIDNASHQKPGN